MLRYRQPIPLVLILPILFVIAFSPPAGAATLLVTTLNDDGPGSLRQAILDVNASEDTDNTILFQSGLSGFVLSTGGMTINKNLTLEGLGESLTTIIGNNARIFTINADATVSISDLKLQNGGIHNNGTLTLSNSTIQSSKINRDGGAIYNNGTLTVNNSTMADNSAYNNGYYDGSGGGIFNAGILNVNDSTLVNNSAVFYGGGVFNAGTATLTNTILTDNLTSSPDFGRGGGILNGGDGTLTIENSILSGNIVPLYGGNIFNGGKLTINNVTLSDGTAIDGGGVYNKDGDLVISNSTLSNNSTTHSGGSIYHIGSGTMNVRNSTLSGNSALGESSGLGGGAIYSAATALILNSTIVNNSALGVGGGIWNTVPLSIGNSIVVGNTAPTGKEIRSNGTLNSLGHNLFGENAEAGLEGADSVASDLILAGSMTTAIAPLADNGGPTQTHLPIPGSPAIDAGDNTLIPQGVTTDQRGEARIQNGLVDIGAVEFDGGGVFTITATAGAGGAIRPESVPVNFGSIATFTVIPDTDYFANVSGCGGTLDGTTYTTGPITADCMISASFYPNTSAYTVTSVAGSNGTISPDRQLVNPGGTTTFTVTPAPGYVATAAGCQGALAGTLYTTGPILVDCTVIARFTPGAATEIPVVTTPTLPDLVAGVPYGVVLNARGGRPPYTYAATGLPPGLALSADGVVSGTPTTNSSRIPVVITVADQLGRSGTRTYDLSVTSDLTLVTTLLAEGLVDTTYAQTLYALGGRPPYTFSARDLPSGLTLSEAGFLSGAPVEAGESVVELTVTDTANHSVTLPTLLVVRDATFTEPNPEQPNQTVSGVAEACEDAVITTRTLKLGDPGAPTTGPDGIDLPYGLLEITVTGCQAGQTVLALTTVYPEPLPPGTQYWKYGPTEDNREPHWYVLPGAIVQGNAITLLITDGGTGDSDLARDGNILDPGGPGMPNLAISGGILSRTPLGQPYRATLEARYVGTPVANADTVWSVAAGVLPPGLALTQDSLTDATVLKGVPTTEGVYFFTLQVINRANGNALSQQDYRIEITGGDSATTLITHYYVSILERQPEEDGLAFWKNQITEKQANGEDVKPVFREMAAFFFFSDEYIGRNTTNIQFLTNLYLTFFQREPDDEGLEFWLTQLVLGSPRYDVMLGFLFSPEFTGFMEALGF
ncbi:MAG: DUF4214 domain-containing protein [Gammaproteobacteria bacterium]|nr:DUF4214 domain-containing protein [Gammaproteobacteria bacterium]HRX69731.1 choice-of-anchor Q domain-containing protein [Candidatus Competibacteraceae bacterium]